MKTKKRIFKTIVLTASILFFLASCNEKKKDPNALNDAEIASIAVTANQIDVDYGKIALDKSSNPEIQKFAQTMIDDHTAIIGKATDLAKKLNVTPEDNATTQSLLDGAKKEKEDLNSKSGMAFDKAYINNEVSYHEAVISTVKDKLIPQAENQELKDLLQSVLPLLEHHLEMAKQAQSGIANAPELNDAQIASIAVTANQIDVEYGKIALKKGSNAEVKKFAQTMVDDHSAIIKKAVDLAGKLGVTPEDNPTTQSLLDGAEKIKADLNSKKGKEFDKAYIDNEVSYHEAAISIVKNTLIPQTQNEELRDLLQSAVPLFEHHLEMAKKAQADLK
ncbi:DUF4142 domain-containing protein [Aequorivita ciconiae]|uniref:DUF4142 domain-containing protein n=1 Tax=Aequorivita ciconiae TaxID=2494375 RepID=UPI00196B98C4|nr:DUF4142 domain-containing protein [Aequorivita sp. H23M31]